MHTAVSMCARHEKSRAHVARGRNFHAGANGAVHKAISAATHSSGYGRSGTPTEGIATQNRTYLGRESVQVFGVSEATEEEHQSFHRIAGVPLVVLGREESRPIQWRFTGVSKSKECESDAAGTVSGELGKGGKEGAATFPLQQD